MLQAAATGSQLIALLVIHQRLRHPRLLWWTVATSGLLLLALLQIASMQLQVWFQVQGLIGLICVGTVYSMAAAACIQTGRPIPSPAKWLLPQLGALLMAWSVLGEAGVVTVVSIALVAIEGWLLLAVWLLLTDPAGNRSGHRLTGWSIVGQAVIMAFYPLALHDPLVAETGYYAIAIFVLLQGTGVLLTVLSDTERRLQDLNDRLQVQIEERTQALVRAERMAMLGQISAKVAHELKNKLNVINAALYFLSQEHVTAERRERTRQRVEQTITATAQLVSDLLQLARPQQTAPGPVDLVEVLEPILHAVVPAMVSIQREVPADLPPVMADRQQVEQVLLNVVINAVEAMPHGGSLVVSLHPGGDRVRLTISDTGDGIASADLPKVFETFWTTKAQGTGLGLSISRSLIERQGGRIELTQGNDKGTQVVIQLPTAT